jgi:hypothetical protein
MDKETAIGGASIIHPERVRAPPPSSTPALGRLRRSDLIEAISGPRFLKAGSLCLCITGYIAIDACGHQRPTRGEEKAGTVPFFATAAMLVAYRRDRPTGRTTSE